MNKKLKDILLEIDNTSDLKDAGVLEIQVEYNLSFIRKMLSLVFKSYKDIKTFDLENWITFREGIIKNLYEKKLCKIKFIG